MKSCRRWAGAKKVSKLLSTALSYHSVDGLSGGTHGAIRSLDKRLELVKFTKNTIDSLVDKKQNITVFTLARQLGLSGSLLFYYAYLN